jgi:cytochrome c-type biogenesis protein CcmH
MRDNSGCNKYLNLLGIVTLTALAVIVVALSVPVLTLAQDGGKTKVSDDEVNKVANKLYCPVCENITLDTCGTAACAQWRQEIRLQLEEGKTFQQVIDNFVSRYGDRVVGTPQDPTLRALSLVTPWLLSIAGLATAASVFLRWQHTRRTVAAAAAPPVGAHAPTYSDEDYRARLERDLAKIR